MSKKIKVLVVEDSAFMRKALKEILESDYDIEVLLARDGEDGVAKAREYHPDVVTMDINLPGMDGITALQYIVSENICPVVMISSLTQEGAITTFEALELGAFDYVPKPSGTISLDIKEYSKEIISKVKQAYKYGKITKLRHKNYDTKDVSIVRKQQKLPKKVQIPTTKVEIAVALGISTGGPKVLSEIIPQIPENLGAALFIVQHMPANFTKSFADRLNNYARIPIKEAEAGEVVHLNHGYVGKGGFHLQLRKKSSGEIFIRLNNEIPHLFVPSVDVMMESVLSIFGTKTIAVLMTGMGDDGADAMVKVKQAGGVTIAESEETAVVFGMPKEAIERGGAQIVVPSYQIVAEIIKAIERLK